jgi:hypothetical protein
MRVLAARMLRGGVAGFVATAPMTAFMAAAYRWLPRQERVPLPPRQITEQVGRRAAIPEPREERNRVLVTLVAHFGYGGAAGALYGLLPSRDDPHPAVRGVVFGLAVWTGSYLGLLPALGLLPIATRHPWRRNLLMIAAHVVWGATTGGLAYALAGAGGLATTNAPTSASSLAMWRPRGHRG